MQDPMSPRESDSMTSFTPKGAIESRPRGSFFREQPTSTTNQRSTMKMELTPPKDLDGLDKIGVQVPQTPKLNVGGLDMTKLSEIEEAD